MESRRTYLKQFILKWKQRVLNTEPSDREKAEGIIREIYKISSSHPSLKGHPEIVWVNSPSELSNLKVELKEEYPLWLCELFANCAVDGLCGNQKINEIRNQSKRQKDNIIRDLALWETYLSHYIFHFREFLEDFLNSKELVNRLIYLSRLFSSYRNLSMMYTQKAPFSKKKHACHNLELFFCWDFLNTFYGIAHKPDHRILFDSKYRSWNEIFLELIDTCFMWFIHKDIVILCERPAKMYVDAKGNIHRADKPAVIFRDKTFLWAFEGVLFSEDPFREEYEVPDESQKHRHRTSNQ